MSNTRIFQRAMQKMKEQQRIKKAKEFKGISQGSLDPEFLVDKKTGRVNFISFMIANGQTNLMFSNQLIFALVASSQVFGMGQFIPVMFIKNKGAK